MIMGCHELHKVVLYHIGIFTGQGTFHIGVDNALLRNLLADIVVDELGVVLGAHACEGGALRLRDPKLFEGVLDLLRNLGPVPLHLCIRADIGGDVVHVQPFDGRAPVRNLHFMIYF